MIASAAGPVNAQPEPLDSRWCADGAETGAQAALWGGEAGEPFDPCYHRPCDTIDHISLFALDINADAMAYSVLALAMDPDLLAAGSGR